MTSPRARLLPTRERGGVQRGGRGSCGGRGVAGVERAVEGLRRREWRGKSGRGYVMLGYDRLG